MGESVCVEGSNIKKCGRRGEIGGYRMQDASVQWSDRRNFGLLSAVSCFFPFLSLSL